MLRSSFLSRIKRACNLSAPTLFQSGDIRHTFCPHLGRKFERSQYGCQNSGYKSTTPGEGKTTSVETQKEQADRETISATTETKEEQVKQIEEKEVLPKPNESLEVDTNEDIWKFIRSKIKPLSPLEQQRRDEECNRIIKEIFGPDEQSQQQTGLISDYNYFYREPDCNIVVEPIIAPFKDDTLSRRVFDKNKMYQEVITEESEARLIKDDFRSLLCYEAIIIKDEQTKSSHRGKGSENLCNDENEKYEDVVSVDSNWDDAYKNYGESRVKYNFSHAIDMDTIRLYKRIKRNVPITEEEDQIVSKRMKLTDEEMSKIIFANPYESDFVNTMTSEYDEKLVQKIENIDETPLVEAENPKIEELRYRPRVLGNSEEMSSESKVHTVDIKHDETPKKEVDIENDYEYQTKPSTDQPYISVKTNPLREANVNSKDLQMTSKTVLLNDKNSLLAKGDVTNPQHRMEPTSYENVKKQSVTKYEAEDLSQTRHSNLTKKDTKTSDSFLKCVTPANEKLVKVDDTDLTLIPYPTMDDEHIEEVDEYDDENLFSIHMDPKHVLTCNETCAISPHSLLNNATKEASRGVNSDTFNNPDKKMYFLKRDLGVEDVAENLQDTTQFLLQSTDKINKTAEKLKNTTEKLEAVTHVLEGSTYELKAATPNPKLEVDESKKMSQQGAIVSIAPPITIPDMDRLPLPNLDSNMKLSELLNQVRKRNQLLNVVSVLAEKQKKPIPPLSLPMDRTKVPPAQDYQQLKPIPRICVPKGIPKKNKCVPCDLKLLGLYDDFSGRNALKFPEIVGSIEDISGEFPVISDITSSCDLVENFLFQLGSIGDDLHNAYDVKKKKVFEAVMINPQSELSDGISKLNRVRDFDSWNAIPSTPYWKKEKRPKLQTPKNVYKEPPPSPPYYLPGGMRPSKSFPLYPTRLFIKLDIIPVSMKDDIVENNKSD